MLDDHTGRCFELFDTFERRIRIGDVVEGKRLALDLSGGGDTGFRRLFVGVERRSLVRVLAVAHFLRLVELQVDRPRQPAFAAVGPDAPEVVRNSAIVIGSVLECLDGQVEACFFADATVVAVNLIDYAVVVARVNHDGDIGVVLGRCPDHGRASYIDVLDRVFQAAVFVGDGRFKRVEVDDDKVDRRYVVVLHHTIVDTAASEYTAMDFRVQGLHATAHDFGEARVPGDFGNRDKIFDQQPGGTAGREYVHSFLLQYLCKIHDAGFIGYADQRAAHRPVIGVEHGFLAVF